MTEFTLTQEQLDQKIQEAKGPLEAKVQELLDERKKDAKAKRDAEAAKKAAEEEAAKKAGDIEALEAQWKAKIQEATSSSQEALDNANKIISNLTIDHTALAIASEIAVEDSVPALKEIISNRLAVEIEEGKAVVKVRNKDGSISVNSIDEFKKEISSTPAYKRLIASNKSSGGGAANPNGGAGGGNRGQHSDLKSKVPGFDKLPVT
tara:strand:- start:16999 stop:17619 length:621 start_codon:yes stop_codon:yes gene_type:complete